MSGICVKSGMEEGLTATVIVVKPAHCPASGVKVYVVVAVLLIAGLHVPMILLLEVVGKVNDAPLQISLTCVKIGVTAEFTVTVIVAVVAH
jgi:hypothetical protein